MARSRSCGVSACESAASFERHAEFALDARQELGARKAVQPVVALERVVDAEACAKSLPGRNWSARSRTNRSSADVRSRSMDMGDRRHRANSQAEFAPSKVKDQCLSGCERADTSINCASNRRLAVRFVAATLRSSAAASGRSATGIPSKTRSLGPAARGIRRGIGWITGKERRGVKKHAVPDSIDASSTRTPAADSRQRRFPLARPPGRDFPESAPVPAFPRSPRRVRP